MSEECQELRNIKYKTMLLSSKNKSSNSISSASTLCEDMKKLDIILSKETEHNQSDTWNKLDKSNKLSKLTEYCNVLQSKYNLSDEEKNAAKSYLFACLEKKHLQKARDISYQKDKGIIDIPQLQWSVTNRKFTFKRKEGHGSTAKCLGPKRAAAKNKTKSPKLMSDKNK